MNIAMIGSGTIAERHLGTLARLPEVRVVGHVARTRASSEDAAARWGGTSYRDVEDLLRSEDLDAAWVTVPPDAHDGIDERLIEAGVPFLVEKPLSADRATAVRIGARLRERPLPVAVGYQWRGMDTLPTVREALRHHPVRMAVGAWHGLLPPPAWWREEDRCGGQMVEQATHLVDLARALLGEAEVLHAADAHRDRSETDVPGVAAATLQFASGPLGVFTAANVLPAADDVSLHLVCDDLAITVDRERVVLDDGRERREVRRAADPIEAQNRAFLEAVRTGDPRRPLSTYADALLTHHLTHDVLDAARAAREGGDATP